MADVRKEGPHFRTVRRIYRDNPDGVGRTLLFPEGKLLRPAEVEGNGLEVESEKKPSVKSRKPSENK